MDKGIGYILIILFFGVVLVSLGAILTYAAIKGKLGAARESIRIRGKLAGFGIVLVLLGIAFVIFSLTE